MQNDFFTIYGPATMCVHLLVLPNDSEISYYLHIFMNFGPSTSKPSDLYTPYINIEVVAFDGLKAF